MSELAPEHGHPPQRRGIFYYLVGVFLNVVIFATIGPPIGGLLFSAGAGLSGLTGNPAGGLLAGVAVYVLFALFAWPIIYFLAGAAAIATGILVALASIVLPRVLHLYAFAGVSGAAASLLGPLYREPTLISPGSVYLQMVLMGAGAIAAILCTRIARPFRLRASSLPEGLPHDRPI